MSQKNGEKKSTHPKKKRLNRGIIRNFAIACNPQEFYCSEVNGSFMPPSSGDKPTRR